MQPSRRETKAAITVVRDALKLAREGSGAIHSKVGRDVVTDADVAIEDMIRSQLRNSFPWPVIGEERVGEVSNQGLYWLVDPICGTRNYASGIPLYAVNVALIEKNQVVSAVVGDGSTGSVSWAERGRGSWIDGTEPNRLATSNSTATVDFEWSHTQRELAAQRILAVVSADRWDVRFLGSSLSLAFVACGRLAACMMFAPPDPVHVAAGTLLALEAGAIVTDMDNKPWTLASDSVLCSASSRLHHELLVILRLEAEHRAL